METKRLLEHPITKRILRTIYPYQEIIPMKILTYTHKLSLLLIGCFSLLAINVQAQVPQTPTNLTASSETSSRIRLRWQDQSDNETQFIIERAKDTDANFVPVDSVGTDTTEYLDINLTAQTTYFYRIKAANANGTSAYSNTIGASTVPVTSISDDALSNQIKTYPIPTRDFLMIEFSLASTTPLPYALLDINSKIILKGHLKRSSALDLRDLPKGIYFLMIEIGDKWVVKRILRG